MRATTLETFKKHNGKTSQSRVNFESIKKLSHAYVLSTSYLGKRRKALLKLYEPKTQKIYFWIDNTGHLPYCLSNLSIDDLKEIDELREHSGFNHFEVIRKYDALENKEVEMTKIVAKDPLSIGGRRWRSIREIIPKAWEARIRYHNCYIYDRQLLVGMPYKIINGKIIRDKIALPEETVSKLDKIFKREAPEFQEYINHWIELFQCPIPRIRRIAIDIEVASPVARRFPDPVEAKDPIIAVSMVDSDGRKRVLLLKRDRQEEEKKIPENVMIEYFENEEEIIEETFKVLLEYPVVLTFNGDSFDLQYLHNRAENLAISEEKNPIYLGNRFANLKYGIHIDLYKFFFNKSIQNYAFSQKYTELTLDSVAKSILGVGKVVLMVPVSEATYSELIEYCLRDSELTFQLTSFDDELVMKLILILTRITKLSIEDVTRQGVSSWIRNLIYFEHRRLNYLIPRSEDILEVKGKATSTAIIKGKKFKGAIVVKPKSGIHFDVAVLDFASLYPSIIKIHNLSYETLLCNHQNCQSNNIPNLPHWVCKEKKGLSSLIIGSLRDIRIKWYKKLAKEKALPKNLQNLYNVVQLTLKVLLNAFYGVMGAESFDLYCPPLAEAVTAIGRYAITKTIKKSKDLGIEVIYGDTDSVFLKAPTSLQIKSLLEWAERDLGMELEIDKIYRYAVFSHLKKNYLGVYSDGKVDIKGLTGKKRHIPEFLQKAFMEFVATLGQVQSPKDFEKAKTKIRDIVRINYLNLKKRKYSLGELALNVMLGKPLERYKKTTPQHVKAAKLLVEAGYEIKSGDIISFVKTYDELGVKPIQLANIREVDVEKYIEYLRSTFEQVFQALGLEFREILGISSLDSFLWN